VLREVWHNSEQSTDKKREKPLKNYLIILRLFVSIILAAVFLGSCTMYSDQPYTGNSSRINTVPTQTPTELNFSTQLALTSSANSHQEATTEPSPTITAPPPRNLALDLPGSLAIEEYPISRDEVYIIDSSVIERHSNRGRGLWPHSGIIDGQFFTANYESG
jgi:hypothetical protein